MIPKFRSLVAVSFGLVLSVSSARAQEPAPAEPEASGTPTAPVIAPVVAEPVAAPTPSPAAVPTAEQSVVPPSSSPLRIEGPNGNSIRLGILLQPQLAIANNASPALSGYSKNLYIRRTRILVGGTILGNIEYFVDTDYPNLFLDTNAGTATAPGFVKNTPGMNVQDAFVTWKALGDMLKVDMGYMLPAMAHNALQGAGTLYGLDYYGYSFQHSNSFGSSGNPIGRDVGLQLRSLLVDGHLEIRAGMFQGLRENQTGTDVDARNMFRLTGRVQINLLDAEPGFFYAGTYLGAKKIASIGFSGDFQDKYKYFAVDGIVDMPLGPGVVTGQVNVAHWDGGSFIPTLVKQTDIMAEAGYNFAAFHVSPILRFEKRMGSTPATGAPLVDQTRIGGGLAFWPYGHNTNVKAFFINVKDSGASKSANQFNLQWQVFAY